MRTKTHEELIEEATKQVCAVFAYYTDQRLDSDQANKIKDGLRVIIPTVFTTEGWSEYAAEYDKLVEKTNWVSERSSGFAGYRNQETGEWMHKDDWEAKYR